MGKQNSLSVAIVAAMCAGMLIVAGCNQQPAQEQASAPASSASTAPQQPSYTPPTADQLYQMVAPIALFPDKLVAQVLAGSTYPDQITAAQNLVTQNPNLKGDLLQAAVQPQNWDASVKGLTQFPSVLSQMAQNIPWTTALGQAYVNDPTDVLNAIQVMRQRASASGNLRSSAQQSVSTQPVQQAQESEQASYVGNGDEPPTYSGPSVVPPPGQIIEIQPAQSDEVYVPSYDPQAVYGEEVPAYPDYQYQQPSYSAGQVAMVGAVAFGAAIVVGALLEHHDRDQNGGWHSWGMNWGGGYRGGNSGGGGGWHRPAVVYNNQTYVSRSTTVINRYTNNVVNNNITNNRYINNNTVNQNSVTNNVANNRNPFNRHVANSVASNRPAEAPMSTPNFSRAGYPPAANRVAQAPSQPFAAPHSQPPRPNEAPRPNVAHQPPAPTPAPRSNVEPRTQGFVRQPAGAPPHTLPQPPAIRPATPEQQHPQPVVHPAPPPPRPQPAFHPAPAPQAHPQPAFRPAPAPAPQARPQPAPAQHAAAPAQHAPPPSAPHPQPQAHPASPQHQNNNQHPQQKKDESHN
ncbi:MAG TPA: DUF3300 domain-containing protein [Dyella sp.]|nr:DUF3300 domain-containing protein [Dyella sp.]